MLHARLCIPSGGTPEGTLLCCRNEALPGCPDPAAMAGARLCSIHNSTWAGPAWTELCPAAGQPRCALHSLLRVQVLSGGGEPCGGEKAELRLLSQVIRDRKLLLRLHSGTHHPASCWAGCIGPQTLLHPNITGCSILNQLEAADGRSRSSPGTCGATNASSEMTAPPRPSPLAREGEQCPHPGMSSQLAVPRHRAGYLPAVLPCLNFPKTATR